MIQVKHYYIVEDIYRHDFRTNRQFVETDYKVRNKIETSYDVIYLTRVFTTKQARTKWVKNHQSDNINDIIFN